MPDQENDETETARDAVKTAPQLSPKLRTKIGADDGGKPEPAPPKSRIPAPDKPAADDTMKQSVDLADIRTDEAVKDIVSYEGDVMLAVADSTAEARNREVEDSDDGEGRSLFSIIMWTLVIFIVIVAAVLFALLVSGANVSGLK